ncbi:MAG: HEPN domain-containing protein [Spirochaetaceae bacterium]|jgi:HEPN domain-containing protein|nr:HEPN domain-containing protein [Spirochaetaceae bacterium]GMO21266.1 MAG: HEPN domain-containing protein [Termitinemataceae bacterium]
MPEIDLIKEWLRYANNDLISARHLFEDLYPKQTEIAAYHCQQCAEKALKAFLFFNDIEPPRIHNLIKLCELCKNIDAEFSIIKDDCDYLNPLSAEVRYPNELTPDESMVKSAIARAQKIYDFCTAKTNAL